MLLRTVLHREHNSATQFTSTIRDRKLGDFAFYQELPTPILNRIAVNAQYVSSAPAVLHKDRHPFSEAVHINMIF